MNKNEEIKGAVIGIDLGTTNSCVSIDGKHVVITKEGKNTTPSIVAYAKKSQGVEEIVGEPAARQATLNATNTLFQTKRFIGMSFDQVTEDHKKSVPFELVKNDKGGVSFKIEHKENPISSVEVAAVILRYLKDLASDYLKQPVKNAVITVPAYFNDDQRQATKDAGTVAGLNVVRIINEPTAAALAYGLENNTNGNIAVYDLGGGTFDVSILEIEDGVFKVLSTNGDTNLGGEDFDNCIIKYVKTEFKKKSGIDLDELKDKNVTQRLKEAAEKAKIALSSSEITEINLPFLTMKDGEHVHLNVEITKSNFNGLISPLVEKTKKACFKAIEDSEIKLEDINQVILVGGSTRIPLVQEIVENIFAKKPSKNLNPDEVVARGAAIQGQILSGNKKDVLLLDVTALNLGIETQGGIMTPLIKANSTIPTKKSQVFSTAEDNQTQVNIRVFQGNREFTKDNKLLGDFAFMGIEAAPRGVPQVEVTFDLDANGMITVSAEDKKTKKKETLTIDKSINLSDEEIEKMRQDAEKNAEADKNLKAKIEVKNNADNAIYTVEKTLKEKGDKVDEKIKTALNEKIEQLKTVKEDEKSSVQDIQSKLDDLNKLISDMYQGMQKEEPQSKDPNPQNES